MNSPAASANILEVRGVKKIYATLTALADVDLSVGER